jgi:hypothetical protein
MNPPLPIKQRLVQLHDLHLGGKEDVSFPQALETGRPVALAVEVTPELGDDDHGFTQ